MNIKNEIVPGSPESAAMSCNCTAEDNSELSSGVIPSTCPAHGPPDLRPTRWIAKSGSDLLPIVDRLLEFHAEMQQTTLEDIREKINLLAQAAEEVRSWVCEDHRFFARAAIAGSVNAIDALMADAFQGTRWVIAVLFKTDSWPVRIRAAELVLGYATGTQLRPGESGPLLRRLRSLDQRATSEKVLLSSGDRRRVRDLDPDRSLPEDDVPRELSGWFGDVANEIAEAQNGFADV